MGEDFRDLQGMRLNILGEASPGESQIVPHEVIDGVTRYECCVNGDEVWVGQTEKEKRTESIGKPKDGVTWEEKCALAGAVTTDGAGDVKVALAYSARIRFCAFAVCFAVCSWPRPAWAAFSNATAGLAVASGTMADGGAEDLETGSDQGLGAFLSDATCFEGSAYGSTPLCISVTPDGETDTVVGDGAASADGSSGLLFVHGRGGHRRGGEDRGGAEIGGGRTGVGKRIVGVGVGKRGCCRRAIGGEDGASEQANVGGCRCEGGGGCGEREGERVNGAGGLKGGGDDLDLAGEGELERG